MTLLLAVLASAIAIGAASPRPASAVSFVDKQVQASSLLIQSYINTYGQEHRFSYPAKTMVKKGGGLTAPFWPSNPWTGKFMTPGSARGTYTYTLLSEGTAYRFVAHLSRGNYKLTGGIPRWFKTERDTSSLQNALLLQRYLEAYATAHGGAYPAAADVTPAAFAGYVWPKSPWTGADMVAGAALGDFAYGGGGATYSLKVKLTSGWSPGYAPVGVAAVLAAAR